MDSRLLQSDIQEFIDINLNSDISRLAFLKNPFPDVDYKEILNQIASKVKAKDKFPTLYKTPGILYPQKISVEQASSETAAEYKSALISGKNLIDLTGGFGIDDLYFSKRFESVVHCELNKALSQIAHHNFAVLNAGNIECKIGDGNEILSRLDRRFDWIYIDPARRSDSKGKVFMLRDCLPEVPSKIDNYFDHADNIIIKTSPLLDISAGLSELRNVCEIHILAIKNDVKELLWILKKGYSGKIAIKTANITVDGSQTFEFALDDDANEQYSEPMKFLFEPNAAIMKSGGFKNVASQLNVAKLHQHSHLYTSDQEIDFPGRRFSIVRNLPYNKETLRFLKSMKNANLSVRNFHESTDDLRKSLKVKDGGENYCFFTTDKNDRKIVLICTKIR